MYLGLICTLLLCCLQHGLTEDTQNIREDESSQHSIQKRETAVRYGPVPYTDHENAPLPNTRRDGGATESGETRGTYYSSETVHSQVSGRVGGSQSDTGTDYDRRSRRIEAERRRREHQVELDRRNREIERRNQERRQSSGSGTSGSSGGESTGRGGQQYSSTGQGTGEGQGTFYTETRYSGTSGTSGSSGSESGSYPVYGSNGQGSSQGSSQGTRQTVHTSGGTYVPSRGGYIPTGTGSYIPSGSYVPPGGSRVSTGGSRVSTTGTRGTLPSGVAYVPRRGYGQSGSYVPSGTGTAYVSRGSIHQGGSGTAYVPRGSINPSGSGTAYIPRGSINPSGAYVPSGTGYVPSGTGYVSTGSGYVSTGSGSRYVPSGSGSRYVPAGGSYVPSGGSYNPSSSVPRYTANPQYDSICPQTGVRLRINGLDCTQAINQFGSSLCYRHEFTSRECCDRCQPLKQPTKAGCEYGDHSYQCRQLQRFDCYDRRQNERCCESCQRFRTGEPGCEYGDMTPRCEQVREKPSLCYIPDNARFCCSTCASLKDTSKPECPWGDQNLNLCEAYHPGGEVRVNCYSPPIARLCCQSCARIKSRYSGQYAVQGCEYGDRPVIFNTDQFGSLNCTAFIRQFSAEQCTLNQAVAENCCFTCGRYRQG